MLRWPPARVVIPVVPVAPIVMLVVVISGVLGRRGRPGSHRGRGRPVDVRLSLYSTRDPPHEQLLVRLGAGGVSCVGGASSFPHTIHPTSRCS